MKPSLWLSELSLNLGAKQIAERQELTSSLCRAKQIGEPKDQISVIPSAKHQAESFETEGAEAVTSAFFGYSI